MDMWQRKDGKGSRGGRNKLGPYGTDGRLLLMPTSKLRDKKLGRKSKFRPVIF